MYYLRSAYEKGKNSSKRKDFWLCALDGYYESPTVAFEDTATKDEMLDKIEKIIQDKYDTFLADSIELKVF